jgi:hypothetical protein
MAEADPDSEIKPALADLFSGISPEKQGTLRQYLNQGGTFGLITHYLTALESESRTTAETAALIPTYAFIASSLHDDAIDEVETHSKDRKQFLNSHITGGDIVFTHLMEELRSLPNEYDVERITTKLREIGSGQLREEPISSTTLGPERMISRIEERGVIWGDFPLTVVDSGPEPSSLEAIRTSSQETLFILTVIDDIEDLPEDIHNNVASLPLAYVEKRPEQFASTQEFLAYFLDSDAPDRLRELAAERESRIETALQRFYRESPHSDAEHLRAALGALEWYQRTVCSVPVDETVPPSRQTEIRSSIEDESAERERLIRDIVSDTPIQIAITDQLLDRLGLLPSDDVVQTLTLLTHIETLVKRNLTTSIDHALNNLRDSVDNLPDRGG